MSRLDQILRTAAEAEEADGVAPVDEATLRWLRRGDDTGIGTVEEGAFALLALGHVHLVVAPRRRSHGTGGRLLSQLLSEQASSAAHPGPLVAWSHADHPAARALAVEHGFERVRELWVMRRPTSLPLPELVVPEGVRIRGFDPANPVDAEAVLAVNAAAFAHHPEQGAMDAAELAERMAEPWFDPAGLLLAVDDDDRLLGFHWTKQHSADLGEVYVVGVGPGSQGLGLGSVLTLAGLHHLAGLGVAEVILYVESDNAPAIRVYRDKLGFSHAERDTHVMYRRG